MEHHGAERWRVVDQVGRVELRQHVDVIAQQAHEFRARNAASRVGQLREGGELDAVLCRAAVLRCKTCLLAANKVAP